MSDSHCLSLSLPPARRGWFSVVALTLATFAVVTTEMLPVGLLTPVAAEFRVPQAYVSLMLTIPALVAALCSPLIILFTGRLNRRYLLMILMLLLMVANICAATATHFSVLVAARIIVGLSIGGIWAIAGGIAVRLVDSRHVALATSLIFAGVAGNFVLGLLSGRHLFRAVFCITGGIALSLAGLLLLPAVPASHIIILTLWGMAYGGVSVTLMNWMIRYSAQAIEITGSLYIAFFNTGIAAGSAAGGMMVSAFSLQENVIAALICAAIVLILICGFVIRLYRPGRHRQANLDQV